MRQSDTRVTLIPEGAGMLSQLMAASGRGGPTPRPTVPHETAHGRS